MAKAKAKKASDGARAVEKGAAGDPIGVTHGVFNAAGEQVDTTEPHVCPDPPSCPRAQGAQ